MASSAGSELCLLKCLQWQCMCCASLQGSESSGNLASMAEGANEGEEGEGAGASADTELLVSPGRRTTEDSGISSMLGEETS